jgi:Tol biopolymer transport system component/predicted Ser/Thr protein kinase
MIGRTLDRYRIDSKLGEGGMGVVYKGHDDRLGRPVAIKVLPPDKLTDSAAKERFVREAKAASALNHPGIITIHDIRADAESDFIVMEWIDGKTLADLIPAKGMPVTQALGYAIQIADALAAAHGAGILHRDLKPSNVMVTGEGRIKILDFGLAKLLESTDSASDATTVAAPLTEARVLLGTAAYMSPEQAEGRKLDARSDIFSFGAVLYEMTTGQRPFAGSSSIAILGRILNEDPKPPTELNGSIPPELEKTILRCLRKDPGRRYQTTADLRVALEDLKLDTATARDAAPSFRVTFPWRPMVATLLLVVVAAAGYFAWQRWRPAEPVAPLRADGLTTLPGAELYPSLSPDGNYVAFTWTGPKQDNNTDIYVQQIGAGSPLQRTSDARNDYNPVWSPDGRWIAFLRGDPSTPLGRSDRELRVIPPLGGPDRKIANVRVQEATDRPVFLTWCPDSTCVIVTDTAGEGKPDALFVIALETGDKKQLTTPGPPVMADTNPAVSPDGRSVLFVRRSTWGYGELYVLRVRPDMTADGEPRHIPVSRVKPENIAWLPSGNEILLAPPVFAGGAALWRLPVGGGEPERLPFVGEDGIMPTLSRPQPGSPARLVYVRSFIDENIWRIDTPAAGSPATARPTVAITSTKSDIHPQLSPDGRRVAFTSTRTGAWQIWVSDLDGGNALQLTTLSTQTGTGAPFWSPDGQQIVFASDAEGQFDIFVVPAGGGKARNITSHPAFDHVPFFSRDGKWIYFSSARSGQFQVWKVAVAGGTPEQVTKDGGWLSRESPDGAYLYFTPTAAIGAPTQFWRLPTSGGPAVKVLDGVLNMPFEVLPRGIYYMEQPANIRIQFFAFDTRRSTMIARDLGDSTTIGGFATSVDGRMLLYARRDSSVDDLMIVDNVR